MDTFAAATATPDHTAGQLLLAAAAVLWLIGYAIACAVWPFANCRKCGGSGKRRSPTGRAYRRCPRCKGQGERTRTGRKVVNWLGVTKDKLVG